MVLVEGARDENRIQRETVRRREYLRVDDICSGRCARPRNDRQKPRVIGSDHGQLGHAAGKLGPDLGRQ